jgi:hypothetical protein
MKFSHFVAFKILSLYPITSSFVLIEGLRFGIIIAQEKYFAVNGATRLSISPSLK